MTTYDRWKAYAIKAGLLDLNGMAQTNNAPTAQATWFAWEAAEKGLVKQRDELLAALEKAIEFVPTGYGIERQCWTAIENAKVGDGETANC